MEYISKTMIYKNILIKTEAEIRRDEEARQRWLKNPYEESMANKELVMEILKWTVTDIAICLHNGYELVATISDGKIAQRTTYSDPIIFHDHALEYGRRLRPRYIKYTRHKKRVFIHIELYKNPEYLEMWREDLSKLPCVNAHTMLYNKGRMSLYTCHKLEK